MKKKYLKPVVEVYEMQLQGALLAASSKPENGYDLPEDEYNGQLG